MAKMEKTMCHRKEYRKKSFPLRTQPYAHLIVATIVKKLCDLYNLKNSFFVNIPTCSFHPYYIQEINCNLPSPPE